MGASLDPMYHNQPEAVRNSTIMQMFSKPISQVNKQFFHEKLQDKLDKELRGYITELDDNAEPYIDDYGRVTYFVTHLGGQTLPIYQTGSIMFETAVQANCEASVVHGGS
jgi:hypothetical protein